MAAVAATTIWVTRSTRMAKNVMTAAASPTAARASPIRWMSALMASSSCVPPVPRYGLFAPKSSSRVRPMFRAFAGICDTGASSPYVSGLCRKPPSRRIAAWASEASATDTMAAASSSAS